MNDFSASAMKNNVAHLIFLACSHTGLGEKSDNAIECITESINNGNIYLTKWIVECERLHPAFEHDVPGPEDLRLSNCSKAVLANGRCNQSYKTRSLLRAKENEEQGNKNVCT